MVNGLMMSDRKEKAWVSYLVWCSALKLGFLWVVQNVNKNGAGRLTW